ncbi:MAG: hypothetical protein B7Y74_10515 [Novosphingobium sp. 35-62-5]|nr:MAG: hypothetical protein B7Y74_10515 [Novosphingobium sp. 35-62-5]
MENLILLTGGLIGTGNALNNLINGSSGVDRLFGREGADRIFGNDGDDLIRGGDQNDTIEGGNNNDTLYGEEGNDRLFGGNGIDRLDGGNGNDTLDGGDGDDSLSGQAGNDVLTGGAGNDGMDGGTGADRMTGGLGNDRYFVDDAGDLVVEASGEGTDTVSVTLSSYTLTANAENLFFVGTGNFTGTGNDEGNALNGGDGDDTLSGLDGNDRLIGGAGADVLSGGAGADWFVFTELGDFGSGPLDRIADFSLAENDRIRLDKIDANSLVGGNQAFAFIGTAAFSGAAGELRYDAIGANSIVYGDVDGDGTADFQFQVDGLTTFLGSEFVL